MADARRLQEPRESDLRQTGRQGAARKDPPMDETDPGANGRTGERSGGVTLLVLDNDEAGDSSRRPFALEELRGFFITRLLAYNCLANLEFTYVFVYPFEHANRQRQSTAAVGAGDGWVGVVLDRV